MMSIDGDPLFSIIITCYNYERYIETSILSALNQDYKNLEVIVVDDGSTDSSWEIISTFATKITAVSTENRGFINACIKGLSLSSGAYIIFLDADDELMPNALSKAAEKFRDVTVTKVQFLMQPVDQAGSMLGPAFPKLSVSDASEIFIEDIKRFGCYSTPPTSGNVYRRDVYQNLGNISYDYGIDGVAYLLAPFMGKVYHLPEILANYRIHDKNMSTSGLSEQKLLRNASVFLERLRHLKQLLDHQGIPSRGFAVQCDYAYTIECRLYAAIVSGSKSRFAVFKDYLNILKPLSGKKELFLALYFSSAVISPRPIGIKLLTWRLNQNKMSSLRTIVKKLIAPN